MTGKVRRAQRPWPVHALAMLLTIDCVLYLVIASSTPDSCTSANAECDGFGMVEDFLNALSVAIALLLLAAAWFIYIGRRAAWALAIFLMAVIAPCTGIGMAGSAGAGDLANLDTGSWPGIVVVVLNLVVLFLLMLPPVYQWTGTHKD